MKSPKNASVHPMTSTDSIVAILDEELPLMTYDRPGPKSVDELLYEAASESNEHKAKNKWRNFVKAVCHNSLTKKEKQKLIQDLDEQKQWSALHYAVANNNYFVTKILTGKTFLSSNDSYQCDINIVGGNGESILHVAAQSNKLWQTNDKPVKHDQTQELNKSNSTLCHIVPNYELSPSQQHIPPIIDILFDRYWFETSIQIDHEDDEGRTPLHLAVMANRYSFVEYLLRNKAKLETKTKLNENVFHFMFIPCEPLQTEQDLQSMFDLLRNEAELKNNSYLLRARALDNRSPLAIAVCHPRCPKLIIETLLEREEPDTQQLLLAFDLAAKRPIEKPELLKPLLTYLNPQTANQRNKLIQIACRHDHLAMLKWLTEDEHFDDNLNGTSSAGYTPLLTAVFYHAKECVKYLLEKTNVDWRAQNNDGETILHILTNRADDPEYELFKIIWEKLKLIEPNDIMMIKDNSGNTPLHCAARANQLELCKQLLGITKNEPASSLHLGIIDEKNVLGQTAVLVASDMGHEEIVDFLWHAIGEDRKKGFLKRDDDRKTGLHLAAAKGHIKVVTYLVETVHMDVDIIADRRTTPLHLACQYGHSEVVKYLLEHKASPILRDARLYNCLEIAIMNFQTDLVKDVLFNHALWREMMRNAQPIKGTKAYDTPMRKLIRYMPEVAIHLIDKKLTRIVGGAEQKVFRCTYDYEFVQDELNIKRWYSQGTPLYLLPQSFCERYEKLSWTETIRCACCCFCCKQEEPDESDSTPYTDDSYTLVRNHPLFIAAQQSTCPELIQHPYNICLRKQKFDMFGIYLFLLSCFLYTIYLGIFTALILQNKHPQYFYNLIGVNYTDDLTTCEFVSKTLASGNNPEVFKPDSHKILRWITFAFLILFIIKNVLLFISLFPKLLRMGAYYIETAVLVLSFVYILDWFDWLDPLLLRCPVQYQIGSFALLLAWINFLTYVRYVPFARIGIYVVMLQVILWKFLQFLPVLMIIICGFGLTYWMLLQNQSVYATPLESIIRTGLMMFDLGYEDRLYKPDEGGIGYYQILYVMFILTGIVLSILVINLMISLAVGELPSLSDQSVTWRHQMMYDLLSDYEIFRVQLRPLVDCFTCGFLNRTKARGPDVFKFLRRRQDSKIQRDENRVFWLLRFGRYARKHFFEERIQDNIKSTMKAKEKN